MTAGLMVVPGEDFSVNNRTLSLEVEGWAGQGV